MSDRFIVINGSETGHCCFVASVIDTASGFVKSPFDGREIWNKCVCECMNREDAICIAMLLNDKYRMEGMDK